MPSTAKAVYIIGPMRLQNELIALCLERETGTKCFVEEDINHIPIDESGYHGRTALVLLDCQGKDPKSLLAELKPYVKQKQLRNLLVLFNVCRDSGVEKKGVLAGIRGFFYEQDSLNIFRKGIQAVIKGELWLSREIMTKCIFEGKARGSASKRGRGILTPRQVEILAHVAVGDTNDEIADRLCISSHTVKGHLHNIFRKINVSNRLQATLWAADNL